ncbi:MAG: methyltransferase family protein [Promethearchaeota archaeon]
MPLYFLSVEHTKLQRKYGKGKGLKIGKILGLTSGWGFFLFLFGLWISPQPRFIIPFFYIELNSLKFLYFSISIFHFIISVPFILIGAWFGIVGVKEITLKVAETHIPEKVIDTGIYSKIRHPQYFGAFLSHIGISVLLSSLYSLFSTPLIILLIYLMSWKEEKELLKEFGNDFKLYINSVPMFIPKIRKKKIKLARNI